MNYKTIALALALLIGSASYSFAHDFWTQPSHFTVTAGQPLNVRLYVGHGDDRDEVPRMARHLERFEVHGPDGVTQVAGRLNRAPAGRVRLNEPAIYTVLYQSKHMYTELAAKKFEAYLREEGLSDVIAERERRGETRRSGKESYARYNKALVRVDGGSAGYDRKLGLPLEITPLADPFTRRPGQTLAFDVEFDGQPLSGITVELVSLTKLDQKYRATTDPRGRVQFQIPHRGAWMVTATHMRRADPDSEIK
ncbi:MAG: DUF4198 domain-containing protein, partial [Myxococcota bacterium]